MKTPRVVFPGGSRRGGWVNRAVCTDVFLHRKKVGGVGGGQQSTVHCTGSNIILFFILTSKSVMTRFFFPARLHGRRADNHRF